MAKRKNVRPHGTMRRSQVITTFGPGAMVDLPDHSVLIGGLDGWSGANEEITEPRLLDKVKEALEVIDLRMFAPPRDHDDPTQPKTGINVWQFPEWFVTQDTRREEGSPIRSRMLVHREALSSRRFIDRDNKKHEVVPVRFVRACRSGHVGDIDWYAFVHNNPEKTCRRLLWVDELGTSGDLSEIVIRCECGDRRPLAEAVGYSTTALGRCNGASPWLGPFTRDTCNNFNRLLIRTASNAYFAQKMSVISLPPRNEAVAEAVTNAWQFLEAAESADEVRYERKKAAVKEALEGFSDDEVWSEIESRKSGAQDQPPIKHAELQTLINSRMELGNDRPDGDFFARSMKPETWAAPWMDVFEDVVLVHRLREVVAQIGFTRFEAATTNLDGELDLGVVRAPLSRDANWVPASENRGEGIFLRFRSSAIQDWLGRSNVQSYGRRLVDGFALWQEDHKSSKREFPTLPFFMLHSFSHLLLTTLSLECGYPSSSIRERIYCYPEIGYGILLYTASPDAEGTLGGLIQSARDIKDHIRTALIFGELCSNDPVCGQHRPENAQERRFLQGAACHGCLLISETSCEQHNDFLDRAIVVSTIEDHDVEFFKNYS